MFLKSALVFLLLSVQTFPQELNLDEAEIIKPPSDPAPLSPAELPSVNVSFTTGNYGKSIEVKSGPVESCI